MIDFKEQLISYITDRRCPDGGFCFYRLNEPNTVDSFYALDALRMIGEPYDDPATLAWLSQEDGYPTIYSRYYAIRALAALGTPTEHEAVPWVRALSPLPAGERPVESSSIFEWPLMYLTIHRDLNRPVSPSTQRCIAEFVSAHRQDNGGYGHWRSTMHETADALSILASLGRLPEDSGVRGFLRQCWHPEYGYLNVPGSLPAYLEHVAAGVRAASLSGIPVEADLVRAFIRRCRRGNGGYSRSVFGGSPNLATTWMAVSILALLEDDGQIDIL